MSKPVKMFEKAAFGYRPEDVDNHIDELNRQISSLEAEKEELVAKMRVLAEKINEYRKEESDLKDALLGAQKMGNTIMNEAKTKADMMITDAKNRADRMVYDAQKQAEETIGAIQRQTEKEKMTLAKMQKEVSDFKATLLATYKRHLNVIDVYKRQPQIHVLPKEVSELIAAGEVIERPASIVKELIENSIDAGATIITVEIQHGGIRFIRITDNGCGIHPSDAPTAFLRHATSKVKNARDLDEIGTLGFRGEALALSLIHISRTP